MRIINVFLAVAVTAVIVLLVLEGGLRLLGKGPKDTGLRFDPQVGWSLKPDNVFHNRGAEFRVRIQTDAHGLRDDYRGSADKPEGVFRVLCLGDSFTLGYTVDRSDLFVDLLEHWWQEEGRKIEVINAGVQAYSTDQQLAWLETHGAKWRPDLVLMFPYENDLYWNLRDNYTGSQKPVYDDRGARVPAQLEDHMTRSGVERTALWRTFFESKPAVERYTVVGTDQQILAEQSALLTEAPPMVAEMDRRVRALFHAAGAATRKIDFGEGRTAKLVVCPIPSHSQADPAHARRAGERLGLAADRWDAAIPYKMLSDAAHSGTEYVLDPLAALQAAVAAGKKPYYDIDWHLSPAGNRVLARYLHEELDTKGLVPAKVKDAVLAEAAPTPAPGLPGWLPWFGGVWLLVGLLYVRTYRDENPVLAFLKVGLLVGTVFTIAIGGSSLIALLPPKLATLAMVAVILIILTFVAYKLGDRLLTALELVRAFTLRGHWYLMPLLAVLVTVGSLLVVAASSPLVAPFIYTLF